MKKKLTMMILLTAITASLIAGCGTKGSGNGNSASQTTGKEDAEDASEFTGILDEVCRNRRFRQLLRIYLRKRKAGGLRQGQGWR